MTFLWKFQHIVWRMPAEKEDCVFLIKLSRPLQLSLGKRSFALPCSRPLMNSDCLLKNHGKQWDVSASFWPLINFIIYWKLRGPLPPCIFNALAASSNCATNKDQNHTAFLTLGPATHSTHATRHKQCTCMQVLKITHMCTHPSEPRSPWSGPTCLWDEGGFPLFAF